MIGPSGIDGLRGLLKSGGLPELGPGPRVGVTSRAELDGMLARFLPNAGLAGRRAELARAVVYIWHDELDAAHSIAQAMEDTDGSYLHGIVHRREPDFANAKYWFQRAGKHPAAIAIAAQVAAFLARVNDPALSRKLIPGGVWSTLGFVDVCATTGGEPASEWLREIQAIELRAMLERFAAI